MSILNKLREKNEVVNLRLLNKLLKAGNTYVFDDGKCLTAKQVGEFLKGTTRYKIVTDSKHDTRLGGLKSISARVYVYNKKGEEHSLLIDAFITKENKKDKKVLKENIEVNASRPMPAWLERNPEDLSGKVVRLASRADVDIPVEEHLIVELYSK